MLFPEQEILFSCETKNYIISSLFCWICSNSISADFLDDTIKDD